MRRVIVTIFAIVVVFTLSSASVSAQGLTGGLKAGMNIANIYGDDVEDVWDPKIGICVGGFITYSINDIFAIQPELLLSIKGSKAEEEILGETVKTTMSLTYLEIPVLAKLGPLFVGPSLAIKLSGKRKIDSAKADIENLKSTDFGLVFGGGVDFDLGPGKLTVDARYTLGLATIYEPEVETDVKNVVISIMVGYSF